MAILKPPLGLRLDKLWAHKTWHFIGIHSEPYKKAGSATLWQFKAPLCKYSLIVNAHTHTGHSARPFEVCRTPHPHEKPLVKGTKDQQNLFCISLNHCCWVHHLSNQYCTHSVKWGYLIENMFTQFHHHCSLGKNCAQLCGCLAFKEKKLPTEEM